MARVYVAGPLFTPQDRSVIALVGRIVGEMGHTAVIPQDQVGLAPVKDARDAAARQARLVELLQDCDAVVALLDGLDVDGGTAFEIGFAAALNRPVLGLRSDIRRGGEHAGIDLMVAGALAQRADVPEWTAEAVRKAVAGFVEGVRVVAGRLVRDGVPRLAKERGHAIAFDAVGDEHLPRVLKRRVVERARHLESSEFGQEQEELADLLELVESLIRVRGYDKESLRAIKDGLWRKRGGYEKGYVVDEEPRLS